MTFYLAFPFLHSRKLKTAALFLSLAFFCVAALGILERDLYGYRLLPGTLFLLLTSSLYFDDPKGFLKRIVPGLVVLIPIIWLVLALVLLARLRRQKWDEALGALSYGVFLAHSLVLWGVDSQGGVARFGEWGRIWLVFLGSVIIAALGHVCVERPFHRLQLALRKKETV